MYLPTVMGVGSERGGAGTHLTPHWCAMTGIWRGCGRGLVVLHGQVHRGDCGDGGDGARWYLITSGQQVTVTGRGEWKLITERTAR